MKQTNSVKPFNLDTGLPLTLINSGDFVMPEIIKKINEKLYRHPGQIKMLPSTDASEIIERQSIIKMLLDNEELRNWVIEKTVTEPMGCYLPSQADAFMAYFHPSNDATFWKRIRDLKELLEKANVVSSESQHFTMLHEKISQVLDKQEKIEGDFCEKITGELKNLLQVQGSVKIVLRNGHFPEVSAKDLVKKGEEVPYGEVVEATCYGWKKYSFMYASSTISPGSTKSIPQHMRKNWLRRLWYAKKIKAINDQNQTIQERREELVKSIDYSTQAIVGDVPKPILNDISKWVFETFQRQNVNRVDPYIKTLGADIRVVLQVLFVLNNEGLFVTIADAHIADPYKSKEVNGKILWDVEVPFPGYKPTELDRIKGLYDKFKAQTFIRTFVSNENMLLYHYLRRRLPGLTDGLIKITSKDSREGVVYRTFDNVMKAPGFKEAMESIVSIREDLWGDLLNLGRYADASATFVEYAKELGDVGYSFPQILTNDAHLISFDSITPLHLIGRSKPSGKGYMKLSDLVPITSIGHLDGSIVCLTGQNAGGKTTTMEELMGCVYQAQCGLPVFGNGMRLNPKEALAMVFLERGDGSTLELLYRKTKAMIEGVADNKAGKIMVFMDELGSATQETAGLDFGQQVLATLKKYNCSVVMSTQIKKLAQFAETIGGRCYKFDMKHRMYPGIGDGNAELLREKIGLTKLLVKKVA